MKKLIALLTIATTIGLTPGLHATEISYDYQGSGYAEVCEAPSIVPALAIGAVAIVAIVAIAVQNNSHSGKGHGHSH